MSKKFHIIAVYGSLRLGMYNFDSFKRHFQDDFEFIRTITTSGFELYDLGPYPCAVKTDAPSDIIVIDLIKVSEECKQALDQMEFGAGYVLASVNYDNKIYPIYVMDKAPSKAKRVPNGDWHVFSTTKNKQ